MPPYLPYPRLLPNLIGEGLRSPAALDLELQRRLALQLLVDLEHFLHAAEALPVDALQDIAIAQPHTLQQAVFRETADHEAVGLTAGKMWRQARLLHELSEALHLCGQVFPAKAPHVVAEPLHLDLSRFLFLVWLVLLLWGILRALLGGQGTTRQGRLTRRGLSRGGGRLRRGGGLNFLKTEHLFPSAALVKHNAIAGDLHQLRLAHQVSQSIEILSFGAEIFDHGIGMIRTPHHRAHELASGGRLRGWRCGGGGFRRRAGRATLGAEKIALLDHGILLEGALLRGFRRGGL